MQILLLCYCKNKSEDTDNRKVLNMNDANKETNAAYEEPKKKVYVKLLVFLVLITVIVVV